MSLRETFLFRETVDSNLRQGEHERTLERLTEPETRKASKNNGDKKRKTGAGSMKHAPVKHGTI